MMLIYDLAVTLQSSTRLQFGQIYIFELLLNSEDKFLSYHSPLPASPVPCSASSFLDDINNDYHQQPKSKMTISKDDQIL